MKLDHIMNDTGGCRSDKGRQYWENYYSNQVYFYVKNFLFPQFWIKILLMFDIMKCKKHGLPVSEMIDRAYIRAKELLKNR